MPFPTTALDSRVSTPQGIDISFRNVFAPIAALLVIPVVIYCLLAHALAPALLLLFVPAFFVKNTWTFCYSGPRVMHTLRLFGWTIWNSAYRLTPTDSASADLIEDKWYSTYRPRWYKLNLWSCSLTKDHAVLLSNDRDELDRLVKLFNETIEDVCAKAAS
jgi:hypothetical protein